MRLMLIAIVFALFPALGQGATDQHSATIEAMGGIPINISAWGMTTQEFDSSVEAISQRIEYLESILSPYRPDSAVAALNRGEIPDQLAPEITRLVDVARHVSDETAGTFDITVMPLVQLWKRCKEAGRLPTSTDLSEAASRTNWTAITVEEGVLRIEQEGLMLDFGGIAKGYFADEAVALLRSAGATRCLVDVGGDIATWQALPIAKPFRIGIRDPFGSSSIFATLSIDEGAVVTSGDYERFYTIEGKQYCHIIDPRTGWPVEGMHSVTLLAPTGVEADALATAVFVLGATGGRDFVETHPSVEAIIVSDKSDGGVEVYISPGLIDAVQLVTPD